MKIKMLILITVSIITLSYAGLLNAQDKDKITIGGRSIDCTIVEETYEKIVYEIKGIRQEAKLEDIEGVEFGEKPPIDYQDAEKFMNGGNYDKAIESFTKAVENAKKYSKARKFLQYALYYKAFCYSQKGDYDNAINAYDEVKKEVPTTKFLMKIYLDLCDCYKAKNDKDGLNRVLKEFKAEVTNKRLTAWQSEVELMEADLKESDGDFQNAVKIYEKYSKNNNEAIANKATAGELRCLIALDSSNLQKRAEEIIKSDNPNSTVMAGAYNCLGKVYLKNGKNRDAMIAFLRSLACFAAPPSAEHEYAICGTIMSMARFAKEQKDADKKNLYKQRAENHLNNELMSSYRNSKYIPEAKAEIEKVK